MAILHAYKWSVGWFFFLAHSLARSSRLRLRHVLTSSREGGVPYHRVPHSQWLLSELQAD